MPTAKRLKSLYSYVNLDAQHGSADDASSLAGKTSRFFRKLSRHHVEAVYNVLNKHADISVVPALQIVKEIVDEVSQSGEKIKVGGGLYTALQDLVLHEYAKPYLRMEDVSSVDKLLAMMDFTVNHKMQFDQAVRSIVDNPKKLPPPTRDPVERVLNNFVKQMQTDDKRHNLTLEEFFDRIKSFVNNARSQIERSGEANKLMSGEEVLDQWVIKTLRSLTKLASAQPAAAQQADEPQAPAANSDNDFLAELRQVIGEQSSGPQP